MSWLDDLLGSSATGGDASGNPMLASMMGTGGGVSPLQSALAAAAAKFASYDQGATRLPGPRLGSMLAGGAAAFTGGLQDAQKQALQQAYLRGQITHQDLANGLDQLNLSGWQNLPSIGGPQPVQPNPPGAPVPGGGMSAPQPQGLPGILANGGQPQGSPQPTSLVGMLAKGGQASASVPSGGAEPSAIDSYVPGAIPTGPVTSVALNPVGQPQAPMPPAPTAAPSAAGAPPSAASGGANGVATATPSKTPIAMLGQAVEAVESGGRSDLVSRKGAIGPMQLMPDFITDFANGRDPNDPDQNRAIGNDGLKALVGRYGGDIPTALAAYNWGPKNVDKWIDAGRPMSGPGALPAETASYIRKVAENVQWMKQQASASQGDSTNAGDDGNVTVASSTNPTAAPVGLPSVLAGGGPPQAGPSGNPLLAQMSAPPQPASGSSNPVLAGAAGQPLPSLAPPAFPMQQMIERYKALSRFPAGAAQAQQLFTDINSKLPEGAMLLADGSIVARPGYDRYLVDKKASDDLLLRGPDGVLAPAAGATGSKYQMSQATAAGTAAGQRPLEMEKLGYQRGTVIAEKNAAGDNQRLTDWYTAQTRAQPYLGPNNQPYTGYGANVLGQPPMPPMMGGGAPRMPMQGQPPGPPQGNGQPLQLGGALPGLSAQLSPYRAQPQQPSAPLQVGGAIPGMAPQQASSAALPGVPSGVATGLSPLALKQGEADISSDHELKAVIDKQTGLPGYATVAQIAADPGRYPSSNPYFESQTKEIQAANDDAEKSRNMLRIVNDFDLAYRGISAPGANADKLQQIRKLSQQVSQLFGVPADPAMEKSTAATEAANFLSQQLQAATAKDINPRVAASLFQQIGQVKPSQFTTPEGKKLLVSQIRAAAQPALDYQDFVSKFYQTPEGRFSNNAAATFNKQYPVSAYSVISQGVPAAAVNMLRQNPDLRSDFDQKYGAGMAAQVLGK